MPFGAFADCISERAHPTDFADAIYVGLEHLDPENLHIRRWGKGNDVEGVKLRFYKGDIIFGRRRAYQRKLAVAEMDGICSAHAMVLRAKPELCLPEFLPFLMMSDAFMKRAVEISVGSLSPTISWGVLKQQSFALPTLDQQRRIAELLWAVDEVMNRYLMRDETLKVYQSRAEHHFMNGIARLEAHIANRTNVELNGWKILSGQELLDRNILAALQDGNHGGQYPKKEEFAKEGTPYVAASHISDEGEINFSECPCLPEDVKKRLRIPSAKGGDVLLTHNASIGRVAIIPDDVAEVVASTSTTYYRANPVELSNQYLAAFLKSELFQQQLRRVMKQSTRDQVPITAQKKLMFVVPPSAVQESFVKEAEQFMQLNHLSKENRLRLDVLRSSLLNSFA